MNDVSVCVLMAYGPRRRESFFAFCTTKRGAYSGTATFCRSAVTVPVAAEAGLSGTICEPSPQSAGAAAGCESLRQRHAAAVLAREDRVQLVQPNHQQQMCMANRTHAGVCSVNAVARCCALADSWLQSLRSSMTKGAV